MINDEFGHLSNPNFVSNNDLGMFKYVRFEDGTILFCSVGGLSGHKDIAGCCDLKPVSAGMICIKLREHKRKWFVKEYGSSSLKVGSLPDDEDVLKKALPLMLYDPELKWEC